MSYLINSPLYAAGVWVIGKKEKKDPTASVYTLLGTLSIILLIVLVSKRIKLIYKLITLLAILILGSLLYWNYLA